MKKPLVAASLAALACLPNQGEGQVLGTYCGGGGSWCFEARTFDVSESPVSATSSDYRLRVTGVFSGSYFLEGAPYRFQTFFTTPAVTSILDITAPLSNRYTYVPGEIFTNAAGTTTTAPSGSPRSDWSLALMTLYPEPGLSPDPTPQTCVFLSAGGTTAGCAFTPRSTVSVPEPGPYVLLLTGLVGMGLVSRRRANDPGL